MAIYKESIKTRVNRLLDLLDNKETPTAYIFISEGGKDNYKLMDNQDTIIDDDNYIFNSKEDIKAFIKEQRDKTGQRITPVLIKVLDDDQDIIKAFWNNGND